MLRILIEGFKAMKAWFNSLMRRRLPQLVERQEKTRGAFGAPAALRGAERQDQLRHRRGGYVNRFGRKLSPFQVTLLALQAGRSEREMIQLCGLVPRG